MKCVICGSSAWLPSVLKTEPDKYEKWMDITDVRRQWIKCLKCGLWHHKRNYLMYELEKIYIDGYRHPEFRGETIEETFKRIASNPSENEKRTEWFLRYTDETKTLLDIGAGLGIFPWAISHWGIDVHCTEENNDSVNFINNVLDIKCTKEIPDRKFDMISLVHVLEHILEPIDFVKGLHRYLEQGGKIFIEVPDAVAFELNYPTHDDFNSCHTHFYDISTLTQVVGRAGFNVTDIHKEYYPDRNLSRIMAICGGEYGRRT